jgi:hypothetical protein
VNDPLRLTLYSRPGCHLCELMRATLDRIATRLPLTIDEVDISTDAELTELYGWDIPVLMAGEHEVARHGMEERVLEERLRSTSNEQ